MNFDVAFPTAYGEPAAQGVLKSIPKDFIVTESLPFALSGQGEHLYLYIRKSNANTEWVSKQLARQLGIAQRDIGYAGLKDRHGITSQWFSLPGKSITQEKLAALRIEGVEIADQRYHDRKLRKGAIKHNHFQIRLRELAGDMAGMAQRLALIAQQGVPNYFDEQRFGHNRGNLVAAQQLFAGNRKVPRFQRGLYLSAARAWIFNQILARRIHMHAWHTALAGDVFWLEGTKRFFTPEQIDAQITERLASGDIHPTGALWGGGDVQSSHAVAALEQEVAGQYQQFADGLVAAGLSQERRPLRVLPQDFNHELDTGQRTLTLAFALPAGAYATAVVRELIRLVTPQPDSLN